ncbi:MAG: hypothetical protein H8D22_11280 [Candidatus Cloacimonetes bacterium]|nr:hypothetical protein [Candidatus Cloacimonadota bacterium]
MKNASKVNWALSIVLLVVLSSCATQRPQTPSTSPQGDLGKVEQARLEKERMEREKKESLRVVRLYEGSHLDPDDVAVIIAATRDLRSPRYAKAGIAGVIRVDGRSIDSDYTEEIECLPGKHTITFLVQFRPDNVPEGTLSVSSSRYDKTLDLRAGYGYRIVFDPANDKADIEEFNVETRKDSITAPQDVPILQQETVQTPGTFVGTVKMFGLGTPELGGLPCLLRLKEYPRNNFFLSTEDAVKYGLVLQEGDTMKLIKVEGLRVRITTKDSWVTSLERLGD